MQDKFKQWKLSEPLDRNEAYRWACIHELQAIRELLEELSKQRASPKRHDHVGGPGMLDPCRNGPL